jgi:hypothetical protein
MPPSVTIVIIETWNLVGMPLPFPFQLPPVSVNAGAKRT